MLTDDFTDELIVRCLAEHRRMQREQEEKTGSTDISKGYAYINDEKTLFPYFSLPKSRLFVRIPDEFIKDRKPVITDNTITIASYDESVCLWFEIQSPIASLSREITYSESTESPWGSTDDGYCLLFEQAFAESIALKGKLSCTSFRISDWKDIFFQIMYSIYILN